MAAKWTLAFWGEHTRNSLEWGDFLFLLLLFSYSLFFISLRLVMLFAAAGGMYLDGTAEDDNDDDCATNLTRLAAATSSDAVA